MYTQINKYMYKNDRVFNPALPKIGKATRAVWKESKYYLGIEFVLKFINNSAFQKNIYLSVA
jgi:hypothetical protein